MSYILYYSNYCEHSKNIISSLSKSKIKDNIHFICIDKREMRNNEAHILLENGQSVILPSKIKKVPALLLLDESYMVYYGNDILEFFKPQETVITKVATDNNLEPNAFSFNSGNTFVQSDSFSFLDMNPDDLSAKGNGGTRQMYNYSSIGNNEKIHTPDDDYQPDKVNEQSLSEYEQRRNM